VTLHGFVVRNALRNRRRMLLTMLSVGASMFLLVTLLVALRELTNPPTGIGASLRIAVPSKVSLATELPARQRPILEKLPGVRAVTPLTWFGGRLNGEESFNLPQFGIDARYFREVFAEAILSEADWTAWMASRTACIAGKDVAERYKLKVGDRIRIQGDIYPVDLELTLAAVYGIDGAAAADSIFFHHEYFDEAMGNPGTVGMWWVLAESAEVVPGLIDRINATFANSSAEVRAETERAFQLGFISMLANLKLLIGSICAVVVFTLGLVTASTMSMAIRERFRELSILKAVGFRRRDLFAFILAESFGLSLAGGMLGAGAAVGLYSSPLVTKFSKGFFPIFEVTPQIIGTALFVAATLGILASLMPALSVMRLSVVEGLRALD